MQHQAKHILHANSVTILVGDSELWGEEPWVHTGSYFSAFSWFSQPTWPFFRSLTFPGHSHSNWQ